MGRLPGVGPFDLLRYTSAGIHLFSGSSTAPPAYLSIDGGYNKIADFGQTSDSADFLNTGVQGDSDPFDEFYSNATTQNLTSVDIEFLDALGFDVTGIGVTLSVQNDPNGIVGQQIALSSLVA